MKRALVTALATSAVAAPLLVLPGCLHDFDAFGPAATEEAGAAPPDAPRDAPRDAPADAAPDASGAGG